MMIDPRRLRHQRDQRGWNRAQLAARSKVSARQISRLEAPSEARRPVRASTLRNLSTALRVPPEALLIDQPSPTSPTLGQTEESGPDPLEGARLQARLTTKAQLMFDLVHRRYGVRQTELVQLAPLFFVLLAEGSLAARRKAMEEMAQLVARVDEVHDHAPHAGYSHAAALLDLVMGDEDRAVSSADLLGDPSRDRFVDVDDQAANPFVNYLRGLAGALNAAGTISIGKSEPGESFLDYSVCSDDLDELTNHSSHARQVLELGYARLSDLPEEIKDDAPAREKFIIAKLSAAKGINSPEELESWLEKWADFDKMMQRVRIGLDDEAWLEFLNRTIEAAKAERAKRKGDLSPDEEAVDGKEVNETNVSQDGGKFNE